jgi:hypothetical protein
MASNTVTRVTELDFNNIKQNFINYLQTQDAFKDYNFAGSNMSTLLDVLTYNTQYNAFYLNMVANEMFLDSALQRGSVVSHAKLLNYVPKSAIAPTATANVIFKGIANSTFTLPQYTNFLSEPVHGVNYNFVTTDVYTTQVVANTAIFPSVEIKQGLLVTHTYTVNSNLNPNYVFELTNSKIDTSTIKVLVQQSVSNTSYQVFQPSTKFLDLMPTDAVYFVGEMRNGNYQISFGDGILGQELSDGNIIIVTYLTTEGTASAGANNFVMADAFTGATSVLIKPVIPATNGGNKESITSIKYQATKSYSAQGRAVTKQDYITAIQQNNLGFSFDAVNVWGGEENDPPVYGQVFISLKPSGAYALTEIQKQLIINDIIKPISVLTVTPTIVQPDYTYLQLQVNVYYDPLKTSLTPTQLQAGITTAISNFGNSTLNTFNSTFSAFDLLNTIQQYSPSIITSEYNLKIQKKIYPNFTTGTTYNLYYNTPLQKSYKGGISSSPALSFIDPINPSNIINNVYIDEVPQSTFGVDSLSIVNPGFGYQYPPLITILGDGVGANAYPIMDGGSIKSVVVTNSGNNYTSAIATITPQPGDTTGQLAALTVNLQGRYGTLRAYYDNSNSAKTILYPNIGTVDYSTGQITLNGFNPVGVDNPLGQFTLSVTPSSSVISSNYNRIITIDPFDSNAILVNVIQKSS